MSLLTQINGELLTRLSLASGGSSGSSSSSIGGAGAGTSFDADQVNLSSGLNTGASAFLQSAQRLRPALDAIRISEGALRKLDTVADELVTIATEAADSETTSDRRATLQTQFAGALIEFQDVLSSVERTEVDALEEDDLRDILEGAGVSLEATTELANSFARVGGRDGSLGFERVVLEDESIVNPLSQNVRTIENAEVAKDAVEKLKVEIQSDLSGITQVSEELADAINFAAAAFGVFSSLAEQSLIGEDANAVASEVVRQIRSNTNDNRLAEHSEIDRELAAQLLGE